MSYVSMTKQKSQGTHTWGWSIAPREVLSNKINRSKTNAMTFSRKNNLNVPRLRLENVCIDYVQDCRYLGVHLHHRLNCSKYCEAMRGKALMSLGRLILLLKSLLPLKSKLQPNKANVRPLMTYASPAWTFINKSNIYRLQVVQNCTLCFIWGYDRCARNDKIHFEFEISMLKILKISRNVLERSVLFLT